MAMAADFIRGVIASWDIAHDRGTLVADDGGRIVLASGTVFDGFTVTAHPIALRVSNGSDAGRPTCLARATPHALGGR